MDLTKILGSLLASGALSKGSGGDVLGSLIGAALGGSQNQQTQGGGTLGDILGSLVGAGQPSSSSAGAGGLGDLLGSLIGGSQSKSSGGGLGDLLGSLVGGAAPQTHSTGRTPTSASDLEDLLGIGKNNNTGGLGGAGGLGGLLTSAIAKHAQQNNPNVANDSYDVLPLEVNKQDAQNDAALVIRAMINAAKSDGSIDQKEQEKVIAKLGDVTQDEIDFVKREFAAPLDVQAFSRTVPRDMAQQVYAVSLMAIDLDKNSEAQYLADLAKGLGISTQLANQMHDKFGVPKIFA